MGESSETLMFYGLRIIPFIPDLQVNNAQLPFDHIHSTRG